LSAESLSQAGLTRKQILTVSKKYHDAWHKGDRSVTRNISVAVLQKIKIAYEKTQFSRLRKAGLSQKEAQYAVKTGDPKQCSKDRNEFRSYAEELVFKKKWYKNRSKWRKDVREMVRHMRAKKYTLDQWREFSQWYAVHAKKPFPMPDRRPSPRKSKRPAQFEH
jgi:hypothetical protein